LPFLLQLNLREQKISTAIEEALSCCSTKEDAPLIAFVSKMITFSRKQINERGLDYGLEGN
jgi:translation elongation factor EF-G